jgi:hypothetical protein
MMMMAMAMVMVMVMVMRRVCRARMTTSSDMLLTVGDCR